MLIDTSATRLMDRMDDPSHSIERMSTRLLRGNLFIPLLPELLCLVSRISSLCVMYLLCWALRVEPRFRIEGSSTLFRESVCGQRAGTLAFPVAKDQ